MLVNQFSHYQGVSTLGTLHENGHYEENSTISVVSQRQKHVGKKRNC